MRIAIVCQKTALYSIVELRFRTLRYSPAKTKLGRNWYQLTGVALVLGPWIFFFLF